MPTQTKVGWRSAVAPATSYLLDTYSGATAAYSLRKLRTAYTGNAITVRRSSDNTSQNIGFDVNGTLDTTTLLSFVGSNNQALYSEEFDNAYWSKYVVSVASNQTTAPDGTMTADLLSESTANNAHTLYNSTAMSFSVGTSWNISVYVKKGPGTAAPDRFILGFNSINTPVHPAVLFDISSGTVVDSLNALNDANFGSSIVDAGNGWWRCSMWGTVTTTGNRFQVGVIRFNNNLNTITGANYAGNSQANMYIWGYQFQKALNDTSVLTTQPYTKTTATANAGNGFVSIWYDQSGNSNNQSSATLIRQPQIVNNGSLITQNSKPALYFSNNMMQSGRVFSTSNFSIFSTLSGPQNQGDVVLLCQHTGNVDVGRTVFISPGNGVATYNKLSTFFNNGVSRAIISTNDVFTNQLKLVNITSNGSGTTTQFVNSTQEGQLTGQTWTPINTVTTLGALGNSANFYTGYVGELVMYTTNQIFP